MTAVLVDSNVLLDILIPDPDWEEWSSAALARSAEDAPLVINPLVYAEVGIGFETEEDLAAALPSGDFLREALPWDAAFLAGQAFLSYRERGGTRRSPLPDFYIGAHASVQGYRLLSRNARRYRTYFPSLSLIAPDE